MHYKDGQEVQIGDVAKAKRYEGSIVIGPVTKTTPGAETCNLEIGFPGFTIVGRPGLVTHGVMFGAETYTASECELLMRCPFSLTLEPEAKPAERPEPTSLPGPGSTRV